MGIHRDSILLWLNKFRFISMIEYIAFTGKLQIKDVKDGMSKTREFHTTSNTVVEAETV